jgi:hypothetical protein
MTLYLGVSIFLEVKDTISNPIPAITTIASEIHKNLFISFYFSNR